MKKVFGVVVFMFTLGLVASASSAVLAEAGSSGKIILSEGCYLASKNVIGDKMAIIIVKTGPLVIFIKKK
jgi:hypothetical protein